MGNIKNNSTDNLKTIHQEYYERRQKEVFDKEAIKISPLRSSWISLRFFISSIEKLSNRTKQLRHEQHTNF